MLLMINSRNRTIPAPLRGLAITRLLAALSILAAVSWPVDSQTPAQGRAHQDDVDAAERARETMKLARAAIGGEEAMARIETISASGKYRRIVKYVSVQSPRKVVEKEKSLSGKMEFEFILPDKYRRRVTGETMRGYGYSFAQVVSGENAWRDPPLRPISSYGDRRVIDVRDVERTEFIQATGAKQELTYYSMGWILNALPLYPLEMSYEGVVQAEGEPAHAILAQGQSGFRFAILLDHKTYTPTAIALSFVEQIQPTVIVEAAGYFDRRFMQESFARARTERRERTKPPQQYEMLIKFTDRRPVEGVMLPYKVTTMLNGVMIEEMTMNEFEINRSINPKRFEGPPKPKD
jgi:hypothetical protein